MVGNQITAAEKAYAAGFFDGEGTVFIAQARRAEARGLIYNMRVMASQVDPTPLAWLQARWLGTLKRRLRPEYGQPIWTWCCYARQASAFLQDVLPYLQVRGDEAHVAIAFQASLFNPGTRGHTDEYRAAQAQARALLMELKRERGSMAA